ncbi:hypothetical protein [Aliiruegeria lutimaris]|uniref:hypothetical protein n=1 Tax=Aliiruegeria lutimaris TaxID=571298 RepID=UPI00111407B6|nr:hypothetical protein [Aliiruegeria lutimaris]
MDTEIGKMLSRVDPGRGKIRVEQKIGAGNEIVGKLRRFRLLRVGALSRFHPVSERSLLCFSGIRFSPPHRFPQTALGKRERDNLRPAPKGQIDAYCLEHTPV